MPKITDSLLAELTEILHAGNALNGSQVAGAAEALIDADAGVEARANFLEALAKKGETPEEVAGFVEAFLKYSVDPGVTEAAVGKPLLDVCGTGGDKLDLFNVSTTSMFVVAGAGVGVVKHGNRGITSKSGGADVLEALGVRIDLPSERFRECMEKHGIGFMMAPQYHPAFAAVVPVRKLLADRGQRTVFNMIGPLLNPVKPARQLLGTFSPGLLDMYALILGRLGRETAWAVSGSAGDGRWMDECSTLGATEVVPVGGEKFRIAPEDYGFNPPALADLAGGDATVNGKILTGILDGEITGAKRDLVVMNAGAAITVAGVAQSIEEGVSRARQSLDSGAAKAKLQGLVSEV